MSDKYSTVTREQVAAELSYNPETGEITTLRQRLGLAAGDVIPESQKVIDLLGISTTPSKLAWLLETGSWPAGRVTKIDASAGMQFDNLKDCGASGQVKRLLPELTVGRLRDTLKYCPSTGLFSWLKPPAYSVRRGDIAGCESSADGYIKIRIDGTLYPAHRLAMLYIYQRWPEEMVDHKNGIRSDNRLDNLRFANNSENQQNRRSAQSNNKSSGLLGVYWCERVGAWGANVSLRGRRHHAGFYETPELAHQAYLEKKRQVHEFSMI